MSASPATPTNSGANVHTGVGILNAGGAYTFPPPRLVCSCGEWFRSFSRDTLMGDENRRVFYALPPTITAYRGGAGDSAKKIAVGLSWTLDLVTRQFASLDRADTRLIILRMNTPGGLDSSMRQVIGAILSSPIPVATYVAPSGARAASAGTYIAYASAVVAMAPGTNIGAATPVQLGGSSPLPRGAPEKPATGSEDAESRKAVNDAAAFIRSLAEASGRNADWAEAAVRSAASLPASQALKLHVVDFIAEDIPDLLRQSDGRTVKAAGKPVRLATEGIEIAVLAPDWRTQLLATLTDPNVAFILLLIGVYGLIFEFLNPGMVAPGLIGSISLLVGLFALSLLPIDYAGAALLLLGIGLMIAEVHIGAFGAL